MDPRRPSDSLDALARTCAELALRLADERDARRRLEQRVDALEGEQRELGERIPLGRVARALGVSRMHALRLARAGDLDAIDARLPIAPQAVWSVTRRSVVALLNARKVTPERVEHVESANPRQRPERGVEVRS